MLIPIVINSNKYIDKKDDTFCIFNSSKEVETGIGDFDAAVYSVFCEQTKKGTAILSDDLLSALVFIHMGLVTEAQLDEKVKQVIRDVENMKRGILPARHQKLVKNLFEEGEETGSITDDRRKMVRDIMAREVVIENLETSTYEYIPKNKHEFISFLWDSINMLVKNRALLNTIHPVNGINNSYFLPKKMLLVRIARNTSPEEVSRILSTVDNKYEDTEAGVMGHIEDGNVVLDKNHDYYAAKTFETINKCGNCLAYHFCGGDGPLQDSTPEMRRYSLRKCHEIYSYWQTVLNNLNKLGTFDGWHLDYESYPELENADVYKMSRS